MTANYHLEMSEKLHKNVLDIQYRIVILQREIDRLQDDTKEIQGEITYHRFQAEQIKLENQNIPID